ncbi:MAG: NAD(+) diphosphatase [Acidobacteria bacterium]|nr:NAD(+) diphosphatase [Acidobacteriota bacterium]
MNQDFSPSIDPPGEPDPDACCFVYSESRLLVKTTGAAPELPSLREVASQGIDLSHPLFLGRCRGRACYAVPSTPPSEALPGAEFRELRTLFSRLADPWYDIALRGLHLAGWDGACRFCSRCRAPLNARRDIRAKECPECGRLEFPRISPAVIMLVEKDDTLLLARSPRFRSEMWSVLAGFVEPGESLEDAVHREVLEETGIAVKDVAYFGSQPWPFPDSLMIGFTARCASGEIRIDGDEICEAGWFRADNLPPIPGRLSIARRLIDSFIDKHSAAPSS